jgi:ABC-type thiamine transport system ATPase subunit
LARRQEHPDRTTLRVGQNVELGVQPALRATDQPSAPPF